MTYMRPWSRIRLSTAHEKSATKRFTMVPGDKAPFFGRGQCPDSRDSSTLLGSREACNTPKGRPQQEHHRTKGKHTNGGQAATFCSTLQLEPSRVSHSGGSYSCRQTPSRGKTLTFEAPSPHGRIVWDSSNTGGCRKQRDPSRARERIVHSRQGRLFLSPSRQGCLYLVLPSRRMKRSTTFSCTQYNSGLQTGDPGIERENARRTPISLVSVREHEGTRFDLVLLLHHQQCILGCERKSLGKCFKRRLARNSLVPSPSLSGRTTRTYAAATPTTRA